MFWSIRVKGKRKKERVWHSCICTFIEFRLHNISENQILQLIAGSTINLFSFMIILTKTSKKKAVLLWNVIVFLSFRSTLFRSSFSSPCLWFFLSYVKSFLMFFRKRNVLCFWFSQFICLKTRDQLLPYLFYSLLSHHWIYIVRRLWPLIVPLYGEQNNFTVNNSIELSLR